MAPSKGSSSKTAKPPTLDEMARLGPEKLKSALAELGVEFSEDAGKAELQALWMLSHLDMLGNREALLPEIIALWEMTVPELAEEIYKEGLEPTGKKWDHVKLLLDQIVQEMEEPGRRKRKRKATEISKEESQVSDAPSVEALSGPNQINLLLSSLYAFIYHDGPEAWKMYINKPCFKMLDDINSLPVIANKAHLTELLKSHSAKSFLSQVVSEFGNLLTPADTSTKIPGFPENVHQFIVSQPTPKLQAAFDKYDGENTKPDRLLMFHGTPCHNVLSILLKGFKFGPAGNRIWVAAEPPTSADYVFKGCPYPPSTPFDPYTYRAQPQARWNSDPYVNFGALLGCEVLGLGAARGYGEFTVKNPRKIMVRYVFLMPFNQSYSGFPARETVERSMLDGFAAIRAQQSAKSAQEMKPAAIEQEQEQEQEEGAPGDEQEVGSKQISS